MGYQGGPVCLPQCDGCIGLMGLPLKGPFIADILSGGQSDNVIK